MYKEGRKEAGLTVEEAAFRLHIAPRTLMKYESFENTPPPDVVVAMAREYGKPEMMFTYCRRNCPIGQAINFEYLDSVNTDLAHVILKLDEEIDEAKAQISNVLRLVVNKRNRQDFTDSEWREFKQAVMQFIDVEHSVEVLRMVLGRMVDIAEITEEHNTKIVDRGYVKEPALCRR